MDADAPARDRTPLEDWAPPSITVVRETAPEARDGYRTPGRPAGAPLVLKRTWSRPAAAFFGIISLMLFAATPLVYQQTSEAYGAFWALLNVLVMGGFASMVLYVALGQAVNATFIRLDHEWLAARSAPIPGFRQERLRTADVSRTKMLVQRRDDSETYLVQAHVDGEGWQTLTTAEKKNEAEFIAAAINEWLQDHRAERAPGA